MIDRLFVVGLVDLRGLDPRGRAQIIDNYAFMNFAGDPSAAEKYFARRKKN